MDDGTLTALFLNFAGVSGTLIRNRGYDMLSHFSQLLSGPLILGGIIAVFLAAYCLVITQGWITGLLIWFGSGVVLAMIAGMIGRVADALLSLAGTLSLLVGAYLFWINFL